MRGLKYIIPELSAQSIIAAAKKKGDGYSFYLDLSEPSREHLVDYTLQDDCPIFYQAMMILGADPKQEYHVSKRLKDVFAYIDFSGIYDRKAAGKVLELQEIAKYMFRPEGVIMNFGGADHRFVAFERSASMSRGNRLSFVRAEMYEALQERMTLGMSIGQCQLSKLYAYNALLFTSGTRITLAGADLFTRPRIVVVPNVKSVIPNIRTVTVVGDGSSEAVRKYSRVEETRDITVTEFDGEGLISPHMASILGSGHSSFQIRLPYIKGVVHTVDFAAMLAELDVPYIVDLWGKRFRPESVEIILTESMFKGLGWMIANSLSWEEYLKRCHHYDHALYVSGMDKPDRQTTTELNYQFLNTLSMTDDEFRPKDLPLGWHSSPDLDKRHWITKTTESEYYRLMADREARLRYFTDKLPGDGFRDRERQFQIKLLMENQLFINESLYAKELQDRAQSILKKYAVGKLLVSGDNRYLSDDLMRLMAHIVKAAVGEGTAYKRLAEEFISGNDMYAPNPGYPENDVYTILRSPHIARNEEVLATPIQEGSLRNKYFSHLGYVIMVDSRSLIPERLGGADFDGDMVKTIADPLVNQCVMRSSTDLPLLKIPAEQPLIADAKDWHERFITVKNTFSSRVGQISNAALSRGILAYDENTSPEERERYCREVETLAILTGLEIDSAKSGIKPDLSQYIEQRKTKRSIFLRYKTIADSDQKPRWYEPTKNARIKKYFESIDWENVSSNLERLPYLAYMLDHDTEKVPVRPAKDEQLFPFTRDPDWQCKLDSQLLQQVTNWIQDYETALHRTRYAQHISVDMKRKNDVYRILFARGQEKDYTVDELYHIFEWETPRNIRKARLILDEAKWPHVPPEERKTVLYSMPHSNNIYAYADLFCDFRSGGYRLLGDIICDFDDLYRKKGFQKNYRWQQGDSDDLRSLFRFIREETNYKEAIIQACQHIIHPIVGESRLDEGEVVKCAVALGKRQFLLEVLPAATLTEIIGFDRMIGQVKPKKRWRFRK